MTPARRLSAVPDLLTVEEAARVLRIGRTAAYQLAQKDLANDGSEGLHVVRVGRLLRVPRVAIEALTGAELTADQLHTDTDTNVVPAAASTPAPVVPSTDASSTVVHFDAPRISASSKPRPRSNAAPSSQLDLFDTSPAS